MSTMLFTITASVHSVDNQRSSKYHALRAKQIAQDEHISIKILAHALTQRSAVSGARKVKNSIHTNFVNVLMMQITTRSQAMT